MKILINPKRYVSEAGRVTNSSTFNNEKGLPSMGVKISSYMIPILRSMQKDQYSSLWTSLERELPPCESKNQALRNLLTSILAHQTGGCYHTLSGAEAHLPKKQIHHLVFSFLDPLLTQAEAKVLEESN